VFRRYTDHRTHHCSRINLALAADSPTLAQEGPYIGQLRDCILKAPFLDAHHGRFYRGVDLSDEELRHMEALRDFFIPSFTSCTNDPAMAYHKNATLIINTHHTRNAAAITEELSAYHATERETVIACYTAYRLERVERVNGVRFVTLALNDYLSALDALALPHPPDP
jgi:hypothetical protein